MEERLHPSAAIGFETGAAAYERGRPSYPAAAVERLVRELELAPGRRVLDLAAGTGKLTRLLVATGAAVVAVEPVAAMRAQLVAAVPGVEVLDGTAEANPLPDDAVDAATVAQAFHWFRRDEALAELSRVLRPGGGLVLVWNERNDDVAWVAQLTTIIHAHDDPDRPTYERRVDWAAVVAAAGGWAPVREARFPLDQPMDADTLVDRAVSTSFVAAGGPAAAATVADQVRTLVADFPPTFALPYVTHLWWTKLA